MLQRFQALVKRKQVGHVPGVVSHCPLDYCGFLGKIFMCLKYILKVIIALKKQL